MAVTGKTDGLKKELLDKLDALSTRLDEDIEVTSGKREGPADKSAHNSGIAADVKTASKNSIEMADELVVDGFAGVGEYYDSDKKTPLKFAHGDIRGLPGSEQSGPYKPGGAKGKPVCWTGDGQPPTYSSGRRSGNRCPADAEVALPDFLGDAAGLPKLSADTLTFHEDIATEKADLEQSQQNLKHIQIGLLIVMATSLILTAAIGLGAVPIRDDFGWADTLEFLAPVFLIALVIERVTEVLIVAWRGPEQSDLANVRKMAAKTLASQSTASAADSDGIARAALNELRLQRLEARYRGGTATLAISIAFAMGILVSAAGFRVLDGMIATDPEGFQDKLFIGVDVILTGALVGGGAEPIHRLINVFTTAFTETRNRLSGYN